MTLASGCVRGSIVHTDNSGFTGLPPPPPPPPLTLSLASPLSSACSTRAAAHALQLSIFKSGLQWEQQQGCTAATQRRTTAAAAAAAAAVAAQSLSGSLAVPLHCLTPVLLCLVRCSPLLSTQCACMQRQHSSDHTRRQAAGGDQQAPASASPLCLADCYCCLCVAAVSLLCLAAVLRDVFQA
jgi:hypothetical protein